MTSKINVFSYLGSINKGQRMEGPVDDKIYNQFLINRGLSYHIDTIALANVMNRYGQITNQMHYDFLLSTVSPRSRFNKWPKPRDHGKASTLSQYYGISLKKAYDYIGIVSDADIERMSAELKIEKE